MKASEIRKMSTDEIHTELDNVREELMKLRFQTATGELTDFNRIRVTRRNIARLVTLLAERDRDEVSN
ncbi:MAG: 50S ribosomal protein L29 [Anaerolineales bacterium]|jgi:large subunit ribosomal protein L29|nr:50S ribosomal protein L29 [Anaerolineales bacterium]